MRYHLSDVSRGTVLLRLLVIVVAASTACSTSPRLDSPAAAQSEPPEIKRLRNDVTYLASKALAGRQAGRPGSDTAANYIARRFSELGLRPAFIETDCGASACRES